MPGRPDARLSVAWVGATGVCVLAVAGAATAAGVGPHAFDLDAERTVPALASGLVLGFAAAAGFLVGRLVRAGRRPLLALAALFAFMAADEVVEIHERLERAAGVDWQVLYLPLVVLGGAGFVHAVLLARRHAAGAGQLAAGAAAWVVAQILERLEWGGGTQTVAEYQATIARGSYKAMVVVEEVAELGGSLCFLLGLLALHAAATDRPRSATRHEEAVPVDRVRANDVAVGPHEGAQPDRPRDEPVRTTIT